MDDKLEYAMLLAVEDPVDFGDPHAALDAWNHEPGPWYPPGHPLHRDGDTPTPTHEESMF